VSKKLEILITKKIICFLLLHYFSHYNSICAISNIFIKSFKDTIIDSEDFTKLRKDLKLDVVFVFRLIPFVGKCEE